MVASTEEINNENQTITECKTFVFGFEKHLMLYIVLINEEVDLMPDRKKNRGSETI